MSLRREALSLLQGSDAQAQLVTADLASALLIPGTAHLWGCVVEAAEGDVSSVAAFAEKLKNTAAGFSGALFTAALGI